MAASNVYFTDLITRNKTSWLKKFENLVLKAGLDGIDFNNKYVAIKIHFGEYGNMTFLRHQYARQLVQMIQARGGRPFLTDSNTLYPGMRSNALDHLECADMKGHSPLQDACHVHSADGLRGLDETLVPVPDGEYVKEAKIGSAVMDADIVISLNHFKGHEAAGFGGAVKNLGMGCGSRAGKMEMHYSGKPSVDPNICVACGRCISACGQSAIVTDSGNKANILQDVCVGCGRCIGQCAINAISPNEDASNELLAYRMAEYTWAVVHGRPSFHINLALDISPFCDCYGCNDIGFVPDIGMFASFDPIALDKACADAVNRQSAVAGSRLDRYKDRSEDHFHAMFPSVEWEKCLAHCEKLGVGSRQYELITV